MANKKIYASGKLELGSCAKVIAFCPDSADLWNTYTTSSSSSPVASRDQIFWDTTAGVCTAILPASPMLGALVRLIDFKGMWGTNKLVVGRNGNKIQGASSDLDLTIPWDSCTLIYDGVDSWHLI